MCFYMASSKLHKAARDVNRAFERLSDLVGRCGFSVGEAIADAGKLVKLPSEVVPARRRKFRAPALHTQTLEKYAAHQQNGRRTAQAEHRIVGGF